MHLFVQKCVCDRCYHVEPSNSAYDWKTWQMIFKRYAYVCNLKILWSAISFHNRFLLWKALQVKWLPKSPTRSDNSIAYSGHQISIFPGDAEIIKHHPSFVRKKLRATNLPSINKKVMAKLQSNVCVGHRRNRPSNCNFNSDRWVSLRSESSLPSSASKEFALASPWLRRLNMGPTRWSRNRRNLEIYMLLCMEMSHFMKDSVQNPKAILQSKQETLPYPPFFWVQQFKNGSCHLKMLSTNSGCSFISIQRLTQIVGPFPFAGWLQNSCEAQEKNCKMALR